MKKRLFSIVSILLVACTLLSSLFACKPHECKFNQRIVKDELFVSEANYEHANLYKLSCECGNVSDTETFQVGKTLKYDVGTKSDALNGKTILMVGCSYTYYGHVVMKTGREYTQLNEKRLNDKGYFYYMCKESGADVSVTDWCFGGHGLEDLFGDACKADRGCDGFNHYAQLTDKYYDYIVLQDIGWGNAYMGDKGYVEYFKGVMKIFQDANPNVKIYLSFQPAIIFQGSEKYQWRDTVKTLEQAGLIVVDWGTLVYDIWTGAVEVPNSKYTYDKQSFIVSNDKEDGYHQNMLAGYLTTLMLYCTITGETAVGQPFKFATNPDLNTAFHPLTFKSEHYRYIRETNFDLIIEDDEEMRNLQVLADEYIRTQQYTKYCN